MNETPKTPTEQTHKAPQTLLEAIRYFADEDVAHSFAATIRWPEGPTCPRCGCREYSYLTTRKLWKCKNKECRYQYSVKKNTIFEDSPLGFDKWLPAIWLAVNCKNGVSSHELGRALGVHQETAWHMLGRIRLAMELGSFEKLSGEVEADESYVGGLGKNMHYSRRIKFQGKRGPSMNKTARSWGSSSATATWLPRCSRTPCGTRSTERFATTSSRGPPSTRMPTAPTRAWKRTTTTRSSTTPALTWTAKSARTRWRTSGRS